MRLHYQLRQTGIWSDFALLSKLQWETYSGPACMSCCTWQVPSNVKSLWLVSLSTRTKLSLTYFSKKKCAFPIFLFNGNFLYLVSHTFFSPPLPTMPLLKKKKNFVKIQFLVKTCIQISFISVTYFDLYMHSFSAPNESSSAKMKLFFYFPLRYGILQS